MYHLFGKVYVETEFRTEHENDQINISMNSGYEHVAHPLVKNPGVQFGYARSLDDLTPTALFDMFKKADGYGAKVYVYVDSDTYTRLYAALLKALFPGINYEMFKWFFICMKATYDGSTVNLHDTVVNHNLAVRIDRQVVDELYALDDPIVEGLQRLLETDDEKISLEWRIIRLRIFGVVGNIPETLLNLQRRTALNNSHDAMDDWGRIILDPTRWDVSGVNEDALLEGASTFEACSKFKTITDPYLRSPMVLQYQMPDEWLIELLDEIVIIMESCGDMPCAKRNRNLRECLRSTDDLNDPELCLKRLNTIFDNGVAGWRLGHKDSVKYDENLIRYVLRQDQQNLEHLMEHSTW